MLPQMTVTELVGETGETVLSEMAVFRGNSAKRLAICFSALNTPPGTFGFFKQFDRNWNVLFVNCRNNDWYVRGIAFYDHQEVTVDTTIAFLKSLALHYDEVYLVGGSMGGYAALLYGYYIPDATIVAIGPECYPGVRSGYFRPFAPHDVRPPSLSRFWSRPGFNPWIISGEKKLSDIFCLSEAVGPRIISLKNCSHHVFPILSKKVGMVSQLLLAGRANTIRSEIRPLIGQLNEWPDVANLLFLMEIGRVSASRGAAVLKTIPEGNYIAGYLALQVAVSYEKSGDLQIALDYASRAVIENSGDLEAHLFHDRIYKKVVGHAPVPRWEENFLPMLLEGGPYEKWRDDLLDLHRG